MTGAQLFGLIAVLGAAALILVIRRVIITEDCREGVHKRIVYRQTDPDRPTVRCCQYCGEETPLDPGRKFPPP